jgi:hypothetical protein
MANPWDRPPFPNSGDDDQNLTYAAVGRFTSEWEMLESELSHLFAHFIGKYGTNEAYDDYYDKSKTGARRLQTLEEAAEKYFCANPNQADEGDFSELIKKVSGFAERRHEIAHGILRPYHYLKLTMFEVNRERVSQFQHCIAPPHYQRNWLDQERRWPIYTYTSVEINGLWEALRALLHELIFFKHRIFPPGNR